MITSLQQILGNGNGNGHSGDEPIIYDDDYYLDRGDFPPRFAYYRHMKAKLNFTVTTDELNYGMKRMLKLSPEDRYQSNKANFLFHDTSCYMIGLGEEDYGCTGAGCIPECRYYAKYGRIEDSEVIEDYRKTEESGKQDGSIIDIEPPDYDTLKEFLREFLIIDYYNNHMKLY